MTTAYLLSLQTLEAHEPTLDSELGVSYYSVSLCISSTSLVPC